MGSSAVNYFREKMSELSVLPLEVRYELFMDVVSWYEEVKVSRENALRSLILVAIGLGGAEGRNWIQKHTRAEDRESFCDKNSKNRHAKTFRRVLSDIKS